MKSVTVYRQTLYFRKMELAVSLEELKKGLLERNNAGSGLFLLGATRIHTFGMRFPIDVVYLNESGLVIGTEERMLPNLEGIFLSGIAHVAEFNSGTIRSNRIRIGEQWFWAIS